MGVRLARLFMYPLEDLPVDVVTSAMLRVAWLVECARFGSIQESSNVQMSRCGGIQDAVGAVCYRNPKTSTLRRNW